jgi:hypothetical protein
MRRLDSLIYIAFTSKKRNRFRFSLLLSAFLLKRTESLCSVKTLSSWLPLFMCSVKKTKGRVSLLKERREKIARGAALGSRTCGGALRFVKPIVALPHPYLLSSHRRSPPHHTIFFSLFTQVATGAALGEAAHRRRGARGGGCRHQARG